MTRSRSQRGFMLIVAMIVLVVVTLLVVGAIAFTGSERVAAANQLTAEALDSCTQAARNMFLSRLNLAGGVVPNDTTQMFNQQVVLAGGKSYTVHSGHLTGATMASYGGGNAVISGVRVIDKNQVNSSADMQDMTNRLDSPGFGGAYYDITATCKDDATGAEQEVEFTFRLGI